MPRRSALRASDSDRDRVAERLRNATAEGRLLASELEERLGALFSARTYGELDALVADLPAPADRRRRRVSALAGITLLAGVGLLTLAVIALVVMVVTGALLSWGIWVIAAWLLFGRGCYGARRRASRGQMPFAGRRTLL